MRFSLLNLALFAAPIFAFTIPDGQPDGLYGVSYDADGKEIHTLIQENLEIAPAAGYTSNSAKFLTSKRDNSYQCGGDALNQGDTDTANANIDQQCGNGKYLDHFLLRN